MSKKISQLARVIHHLNDRGDDNPSSPHTGGIRTSDLGDLVTVADRYDTETEQILADAAAKVQSFHRACARKEEAAGLAHAVNALRSEHEAAAASHDREMAKLRESNAKALADAENRFANVKFAMDELKQTSKAKVTSLESELATARAEVAKASDGVPALMAAHARELDGFARNMPRRLTIDEESRQGNGSTAVRGTSRSGGGDERPARGGDGRELARETGRVGVGEDAPGRRGARRGD